MINSESRRKILSEFLRNISRTERILWGDVGELLDISLTDAQRQALFVIAESDGMTVTDVAHRLRVTNGAVTQLVDGLVRQKAVERRQSKRDARKVHIILTEFGIRKLNEMGRAYEDKLATIFEKISDDKLEGLLDIQRAVLQYGEQFPLRKK